MKLHKGPPYQRWQLELLTAFHILHVEKGTDGRRYKPGVLAKVVMEKDNAESYVITCQYDINYNQGPTLDPGTGWSRASSGRWSLSSRGAQ